MKKKKNSPTRLQWVRGDELNKWVTCLACYHEYYVESYELNACCAICESKEYEESTPEKDYMNLEELEELLQWKK